jgi:hypothetical protein
LITSWTVQIEKTSKAPASPAAANEFRDPVAFVHQFVFRTPFVRECSRQDDILGGIFGVPAQQNGNGTELNEPVAFVMINVAGSVPLEVREQRGRLP